MAILSLTQDPSSAWSWATEAINNVDNFCSCCFFYHKSTTPSGFGEYIQLPKCICTFCKWGSNWTSQHNSKPTNVLYSICPSTRIINEKGFLCSIILSLNFITYVCSMLTIFGMHLQAIIWPLHHTQLSIV